MSGTLDGTITSWNPTAERLYGHTAQEAIGRPIVRIVPPDRSAELAWIMAQLAQGDRVGGARRLAGTRTGTASPSR